MTPWRPTRRAATTGRATRSNASTARIGRYLDLGFTDVKIKVGGLGAHEDAARVGRVRELIGRDGRVALDANNAWKTPAEAIQFIRMVEEFDPWWIEEPLMPDDITRSRGDRGRGRRAGRHR